MRRLKFDQQTPTSYHKFAIDYSCKYAGFTDTSQYIGYVCCSHMWYGAFVSCNCCYGVWDTFMLTRHFSKGEHLWCRSVCFPGRFSPSKRALQWQDFLIIAAVHEKPRRLQVNKSQPGKRAIQFPFVIKKTANRLQISKKIWGCYSLVYNAFL